MSRPTREQVEAAVQMIYDSDVMDHAPDGCYGAIHTIIAAIEPATDLEIVAQARERYGLTIQADKERAAFLAGVRWREGR